jgi:hypothetical protein
MAALKNILSEKELTAQRWFTLATATLAASILSLPACAPSDDESVEITGAPEGAASSDEDALSGAVAVGATLLATANVNLRATPSTSGSILHVVPSGAAVTLVSADPQNGFYNVKHEGAVGFSYGAYLKAAPPGSPVSAAELLAKLSSCQQLAGTTKFRTDAGTAKTIPVCGATGAVFWKADLDVDCDGGKSATCMSDPDYQSETAAVDSKGKPLDASTLPFVVIPGSSNGFNYKTAGLKLGSVVAVIYKDNVVFGILGDVGPMGVIGEASYAMAQRLGMSPSPTSGGVDSGVTYLAFTGSAAVVTKNEDEAQAAGLGQSLVAQFVAAN